MRSVLEMYVAAIEIVDPQRAELVDAGLAERLEVRFVDLVVGRRQQFAGLLVDDVVREDAADAGTRPALRASVIFASCSERDVARGDALAGLDDDLVADAKVEVERLAAQALGHEVELDAVLLAEMEHVLLEEDVEHLLVDVAERAQQHRHRQLAAAVDAGEQRVLRVELEVEPRAAVGNHARASTAACPSECVLPRS